MGRGLRLVGRALDDDGRPVASAQVRLHSERTLAVTDGSGGFAFDGLAVRTHSVSAHKDDLFSWPTLVSAGEVGSPVVLRMRGGARLVMRVLAERAPAVGARLVLDGVDSTVTDANGSVIVRGLAPRMYMGWLRADGYADEHIWFSVDDEPGGVLDHTITLRRGVRIEGVVRDRSEKPVADATIRAWSVKVGGPHYEASSSTDGTWHFTARAGTYRLSAYSSSHGGSTEQTITWDHGSPRREIFIRLPSTPIQRVVWKLANAAKRLIRRSKPTLIAGVVLDGDGEPVVGADVYVRDVPRILGFHNHTDSRGRFELDVREPGEYEISATRPDPQGSHGKAAIVRARAGASDVRIVLPTGATIVGRVLLDGQPLPYLGVTVTRPGSFTDAATGVRTSDGRFTLDHIESGTWQVALLAPGTRLKVIEGVSVEQALVDLGEIEMERGQRIVGHVRDQAGAPVAGARVVIGNPTWVRIQHHLSVLKRSFAGIFETVTDAEGAYVFDGVDGPKTHPLRTRAQIWASHHRVGASVVHEVRETDETIDFTLLGVGRIAGRVHGVRGGRPTVIAVRADEAEHARTSMIDSDGEFEFEDVPAGDYDLRLAELPDGQHASQRVTVVPDRTAHASIAVSISTVQLTVRVPPGRSRDLMIEPTSADAGVGGRLRKSMAMGTEDLCTLEFVRPGVYRVSLDGTQWTPITVAASPEEQTFDLRQPGV